MRKRNNISQNIWLLTLIAGAACGVLPAFSRIALESMNSGTLTLLRYIYTAIAMILLALVTKEVIDWKHVAKVLPVSVLAAVNAICFAVGIWYIPPSSIQLLYTIVPMIVAILSWLYLRQRTDAGKIVGLVVGLAGVALVTVAPVIHGGSAIHFNLVGTAVVFVGAISFSFYSVLSKQAQQFGTPGDILLGTAIATIICQTVLMVVTSSPLTLSDITARSFGASLVVGLIGTALFYWLYQYIVKIRSPLSASVIQYVNPFFGALWAFLVIGDKLSPIALFGGLVALAGAAQVNGAWSQLAPYLGQKRKQNTK